MHNNIVVGEPLVNPKELISTNDSDWFNIELPHTYFTETRYLPAVLKEAGIVSSTSEVRRNRPELILSLDKPDCLNIKWGKQKLYIIVGK